MQVHFVVLKLPGLKDSDLNIIIILQHEHKPVKWSGSYIMCCDYFTKQYIENILESL